MTANSIAAGSITTDKLAANLVITQDVISVGADIGNIASPGYWLQGNTGNARFGGTVNIGANLTVAGLITAGALNANAVSTTVLQPDSVTAAVIAGPDFPGAYPVTFFNNANYWPNNTRGFAIGSGAAITPVTTGSTTGSRITVNFNTGISATANSASNLVELWRSGSSAYYQYELLGSMVAMQTVVSLQGNDIFYVCGDNGTYGRSVDGGNTWTITTSATYPTETFTTLSGIRDGSANTATYHNYGATGGDLYAGQGNLAPSIYAFTTNPAFNVRGSVKFFNAAGSGAGYTTFVGTGGGISRHFGTILGSGTNEPAPTGFINQLNSIAIDRHVYNSNTTGAYVITVGSGGAILRQQYTWSSGGGLTRTGWTQISSGTTQNLNAVACAFMSSGRQDIGTVWIAVGDNGMLLRSTDNGSTWTQLSLNTTARLTAVAGFYTGSGLAGASFVVVGANGTYYYTTTGGESWSQYVLPAGSDGRQRNLYSVSWGENNSVIAVGDNIVYRATGTGTPVTTYDGGTQASSELTRLAFYGSTANIQATATPPAASQIGNQVIAGTYYDTDYTAGNTVTYYIVAGNLAGSAVSVNQPTLNIQENKR